VRGWVAGQGIEVAIGGLVAAVHALIALGAACLAFVLFNSDERFVALFWRESVSTEGSFGWGARCCLRGGGRA
jgi:hypothetical protein